MESTNLDIMAVMTAPAGGKGAKPNSQGNAGQKASSGGQPPFSRVLNERIAQRPAAAASSEGKTRQDLSGTGESRDLNGQTAQRPPAITAPPENKAGQGLSEETLQKPPQEETGEQDAAALFANPALAAAVQLPAEETQAPILTQGSAQFDGQEEEPALQVAAPAIAEEGNRDAARRLTAHANRTPVTEQGAPPKETGETAANKQADGDPGAPIRRITVDNGETAAQFRQAREGSPYNEIPRPVAAHQDKPASLAQETAAAAAEAKTPNQRPDSPETAKAERLPGDAAHTVLETKAAAAETKTPNQRLDIPETAKAERLTAAAETKPGDAKSGNAHQDKPLWTKPETKSPQRNADLRDAAQADRPSSPAETKGAAGPSETGTSPKTMPPDVFAQRLEATAAASQQRSLAALERPMSLNTADVVERIAEMKQAAGNNHFGRVRIVLDPPNLGTVNLEILVRKERLEVVIATANTAALQALQARSDDIRGALLRQDLKLETFQVQLLQDRGGYGEANGEARQQFQGHLSGGRQNRQKPFDQNHEHDNVTLSPLTPAALGPGSPKGAEGRLSFFA